MVVPREKLLLVVIIRPPGQYRTDVHALAANLTHHVVRQHALGRVLIMPAARRMDVVVARIPAMHCWINPSFKPELDLRWPFRIHRELLLPCHVLRAAGVSHGVLTLGQAQGLSIRSVNLGLKKEIGSKALRGIRIKTILLVANNERSHAGLSVFVAHAKGYRTRRARGEKNRHVVAKANILSSLTHIEADNGRSLAGVATVNLQYLIFNR